MSCAMDDEGADVYLDGIDGQYDLPTGLAMRELDLHAHNIKTDNWGYFQAAFQAHWSSPDGMKTYDCFLEMIITAVVTGAIWAVTCSISIHALRVGLPNFEFKVRLRRCNFIGLCYVRRRPVALRRRKCVLSVHYM